MTRGRIVLGVHIGHDRGAAVVANGKLSGALAQERVDRRKHSPSPELPYEAIDALLKYLRIAPQRLGAVAFSYTNVRVADILPQLRDEFRDHYALPTIAAHGVSHHDGHALATFYTSPFDESLVLIADGSGDIVGRRLEAESLYAATRTDGIDLLQRRMQHFPLTHPTRRNFFNAAYMHPLDRRKQVSLGRKYEQLTYLLGFAHGEAGKTMGLASYGTSLLTRRFPASGLNFSLTISDVIDELDAIVIARNVPPHRFYRDKRADVAATAQAVVEQIVIDLLNAVNPGGQHSNLCLGGGLFLNCLLNHAVLERTSFKRVHILPAAGDDGQAIGAAYHAYRATFGAPAGGVRSAYLGLSYGHREILRTLRHFGLHYQELEHAALVRHLAEALAAGRVVGILRGRSEAGPRALCHRSILADPRPKRMRDYLNRRVKYREEFRPFAPVVTAEDQFRYFDLRQESPYMLLAAAVRRPFRRALAAITHVDGTARVQAVSADEEPFIHALLRRFEQLTGHPVLLNTSFNLADEPIVESPHDAVSTYLRSRIDELVLENVLVVEKTKRVSTRAVANTRSSDR